MKNNNKLDMTALSTCCSLERKKLCYLLDAAKEMEMDVTGYGQLGVNNTSGNCYLWLEYYPFTLYMPIDCELCHRDVRALWSDPNSGDEWDICIEGENLDSLVAWCEAMKKADDDERENLASRT